MAKTLCEEMTEAGFDYDKLSPGSEYCCEDCRSRIMEAEGNMEGGIDVSYWCQDWPTCDDLREMQDEIDAG